MVFAECSALPARSLCSAPSGRSSRSLSWGFALLTRPPAPVRFLTVASGFSFGGGFCPLRRASVDSSLALSARYSRFDSSRLPAVSPCGRPSPPPAPSGRSGWFVTHFVGLWFDCSRFVFHLSGSGGSAPSPRFFYRSGVGVVRPLPALF